MRIVALLGENEKKIPDQVGDDEKSARVLSYPGIELDIALEDEAVIRFSGIVGAGPDFSGAPVRLGLADHELHHAVRLKAVKGEEIAIVAKIPSTDYLAARLANIFAELLGELTRQIDPFLCVGIHEIQILRKAPGARIEGI